MSAWIQKSTRAVVNSVPIGYEWVGNSASSGSRKYAFKKGWQLETFYNYKPLVYYATSGDEGQLQMLSLSLRSLFEIADYEGDVLIISPKENIINYMPDCARKRCMVWHYSAADLLDYCCLRYRITEWPDIGKYNPTLYLDTDILFDAPVTPTLIEIAMSDKLFAQGERSKRLQIEMGVGSHLFEAADVNVGETTGFNSGLYGIPSTVMASGLIELILEGVQRYSRDKGTRFWGWFDQPIANYIMFLAEEVETDLLYQKVRWGGRNAFHEGIHPRGFCHLWGAGNKVEEMTDLLAMLQGRSRPTDAIWNVYALGERHEIVAMPA